MAPLDLSPASLEAARGIFPQYAGGGYLVTERVSASPNCSYRELGEQWRALWGTEPPHKTSREFLIRAVAYGI